MELLNRILEPTPEFWKKVQKKMAIVLSLVIALHTAETADQIDLPTWMNQLFIILEIAIPVIIGTAQTTSTKK